MIVELAPGFLTWGDVDPARRFFDSASAPQVVRSLGPARRVPSRPDIPLGDPVMSAWSSGEGQPWADAMSHALAERYGRWTAGWRWAHDEGDFDGGPVGNWCCPRDSITTPQETLARVVAALCEWREWLESLAGWFDAYPLNLAEVDDQRMLWERAARNLIVQVTDRTGCGSGWHGHCRQVLTWFLSRWNVAPDVAEKLVDEAIGGRFESWTGPDLALVEDVAERLSLSLRPDHAERAGGLAQDHLERWLALRETVPWHEAPDGGGGEPVFPSRDGAVEDIRAFDGAIDPARVEGLLAALELLRADAARGARLDFELLRRWQQHVLGSERLPPFRELPAFAKGAGNVTASARTPELASMPVWLRARGTPSGPFRSLLGLHVPISTCVSSIPSTTATPGLPSLPSSLSSPARASRSTGSACCVASPSRPMSGRTR